MGQERSIVNLARVRRIVNVAVVLTLAASTAAAHMSGSVLGTGMTIRNVRRPLLMGDALGRRRVAPMRCLLMHLVQLLLRGLERGLCPLCIGAAFLTIDQIEADVVRVARLSSHCSFCYY